MHIVTSSAKEIIKEVWLKRKVEKKKYFICAHYLCSSKREKKTNKEGRELAQKKELNKKSNHANVCLKET